MTGPVQIDVIEFNNMVTPYTNRLFNRLAEDGLRLGVLSCTARERNRRWGIPGEPLYAHRVLPGIAFQVGPRRFAHLNSGIWRALGRMRPKLLVLNGFYPSMLIAWLWARWSGTPVALRIDGGDRDMPNSLYHRVVRPLMLRRCRAVLTCGAKGTRFFAGQGFTADRLFEMPLVPAWDPPSALPPFEARETDLLWAAEIDEAVKNASFFIEVARRLRAMRPGLTVRIVGEDRGVAMAERLRGHGIAVRHDPVMPWQDMAEVFAGARLLLLPSRREPWGLVCDEAMQCGTPCLVSPYVGAADDLVLEGQNGRVLPLDPDRWAAAAKTLLSDGGAWSAMSARARADVGRRTLGASAAMYQRMIAFAARNAAARSPAAMASAPPLPRGSE
jgi:glycosyltransferase involved in cell wall biosynthesis